MKTIQFLAGQPQVAKNFEVFAGSTGVVLFVLGVVCFVVAWFDR